MKDDKAKKDPKLAKVFICNTLKALEQYQDNLKKDEQSYSHTLFINACVGFLIVANETVFDELPNDIINEEYWGISPDDIEIKGDKSVRNVAQQMRHSIAHFNFTFDYSETESVPIKNVRFKNRNNNFETKAISFASFKKFVLAVVKESLKIIESKY